MRTVAGGGRRREGTGGGGWSVFDGIKSLPFPPRTPEALMAEIDAAVASSEYARATAALSSASPPVEGENTAAPLQAILEWEEEMEDGLSPLYDKQIADEAYKAACSALAAGRPDAAIRSLHVAIASCPPDKTSALAKLRSLLAIASSQQQKQQQQQHKRL